MQHRVEHSREVIVFGTTFREELDSVVRQLPLIFGLQLELFLVALAIKRYSRDGVGEVSSFLSTERLQVIWVLEAEYEQVILFVQHHFLVALAEIDRLDLVKDDQLRGFVREVDFTHSLGELMCLRLIHSPVFSWLLLAEIFDDG